MYAIRSYYVSFQIIFPLTLTLSLRERELAQTPPQADGVLKYFNKLVITSYSIHYTKLYEINFKFRFWMIPQMKQKI